MDLLLERGANVHAADANGVTVLMNAVLGQKKDIVAKILTRGANVYDVCREGLDAIALSISMENDEITHVLVHSR